MGVDVLLLVLGSGNVPMIVSLDTGPDSSLLRLGKHSTPDPSVKHMEEGGQ